MCVCVERERERLSSSSLDYTRTVDTASIMNNYPRGPPRALLHPHLSAAALSYGRFPA